MKVEGGQVRKFSDSYDEKTIGGSLLSTIEDCEMRAFARRFRSSLVADFPFLERGEDKEYPDSVAQRIGKAIHKAVEHGLKHKLNTGEILGEAALLTVAIECFLCGDNELPTEPEYDDGKSAFWCHRNKHAAITFIVKAIPETVAIVEKIQPALIEDEIEIELECLPGWKIKVHPDVVDIDGFVHDVKTLKYLTDKVHHQAQLGLYAVALSEKGHGINGACVDAIEKGTKGGEQKPAATFHYNVQACADHAIDLITNFARKVDHYFATKQSERTTRIFKRNTQSTLCSKRWCPVFGTEACPVTQEPQS